MDIATYIRENWKNTIRETSCRGHGMITMTRPFSSPSIEPLFEDFYYWDTYFINLGLLADGLFEQAKNNLTNIAFFIRHMGYMPNASHLHYTSQPPLFTRAVFDYYEQVNDESVLEEYLDAILLEYNFFAKDRMTRIGLNQYGCVNFIKSQLERHYGYFSRRVGIKKETEEEQIQFVKNMFAVCESGWDCSPCCDAPDQPFAMDRYVQISLNSLLYDVEKKIAYIYQIAKDFESEKKFLSLAETRKKLMNEYMMNKDNGIYYDYNFVDKMFSTVASTASFYPYAVGLSSDKNGLRNLLGLLEQPYGVSTCEYKEKEVYLQWDYPLMWAPQVYFTYVALKKNSLIADAKRIAIKYRETVERNYVETGILWEKYNAKTGGIGSAKDSAAHPMLGWTAAVYQYLGNELASWE